MSSVGFYNTYYQQQSQTYTVPITGCEHKGSSGCNSVGQSPKCCYCNNPASLSTGLSGNLSIISKYCPPCRGFWARKLEAGKAKASTGNSSASASRESPEQARSPVAGDNYFSRLSAPFSSVPYIPQAAPHSPSRSVSAAASRVKSSAPAAATPAQQPHNGWQNAKKRPRQEQHKHSNSENNAGSYKRSGGEGSSAGNAIRAEQSQSTGRSAYACPAVRAMNSRSVSASAGNEPERRWTLANPYGVPGGAKIPPSDPADVSADNSNTLRPAGTSSNNNGGFQTYKPPGLTYPLGHTPNLSINTTLSPSRNVSYQNYKPPKGPSYQPYRPGATSTPTSPNDNSSTAHLNTITQLRETRPGNTNTPSNARSNSNLTPLAIVTVGGNTIVPEPPARNPNRNLPESPGPDFSPVQGPQSRTTSSLRLGDNTISTRSDSAPRVGVSIPVERFRTRSWDGAPVYDPPEGSWAAEIVNEFLPPIWASEASAAESNTANEQNSTSANPPAQPPPVQAPETPQNSEAPVNVVSSGASPVVESPTPRVPSHWLTWSLSNTPGFPQGSAESGPSAAPTISWGSGDTRRNTVAGPPQSQDTAPDSPASSRRKLVVSGRTIRPSPVGQLHPPAFDSYGSRCPPPMETAIPPQQTPPVFLIGNGTGGWPSTGATVHIQRHQPDLDVWPIDNASASFFGLESYRQTQANRQEQSQADRREGDINSRWGVGSLPHPVENPTRRGSEHTGYQEPRARRRSPPNQSSQDSTPQNRTPQNRSLQNRSPRQRGQRSPNTVSPTTSPLPQQPVELTGTVAPQPQGQPQPQTQSRTSTSSANPIPVIPPIPSVASSPSGEWETWDQAAWTAAANEIDSSQPDVGRMAENASILLELFHKTKPRKNTDIGDEHKEMIENAYKSIMEIKREIQMPLLEGNAAAGRKKDDSQNADDCIVCFSSYADTVLLPCKHMVLCGECCDKMNFKEKNHTVLMKVYCPVCRAVVDDRMRIYRG